MRFLAFGFLLLQRFSCFVLSSPCRCCISMVVFFVCVCVCVCSRGCGAVGLGWEVFMWAGQIVCLGRGGDGGEGCGHVESI